MSAQWSRLSTGIRTAIVVGPLLLIALAMAADLRAGITVAVLVVGVAAVSVVYVKNRSDRHNAAVDRGEIPVIPDPHFRPAGPDDLPQGSLRGVDDLVPSDVGRVLRFDGGWIVRRRNPRDVAVILGDDGGWARFDPRTVTDLWAVGEYRAGRGRDG